MGAYQFFVQADSERRRREGGGEKLPFSEASKAMAARWAALGEEEKATYSSMAVKDKERAKREMAAYDPSVRAPPKLSFAGIFAPKRLSGALVEALGGEQGCLAEGCLRVGPHLVASQTLVVKTLFRFFKERGLKAPEDRRFVVPDAALSALFGSSERFAAFSVTKLVQPHLLKAAGEEAEAWKAKMRAEREAGAAREGEAEEGGGEEEEEAEGEEEQEEE